MMRWSRAIGTPVVDTTTAEEIGRVDGLVIDPESTTVVSIVVGEQLVGFSGTGGIGKDAVTLEGTGALRSPGSTIEERAVARETDPLRKRVFTEDGVEMGSVTDVEFDAGSGAVQRIVLSDDEVAGSRLLGLGSDAVVVASVHRSTSSGDLSSLTRDELYEMARDRDIEGRSSMDKAQLRKALG